MKLERDFEIKWQTVNYLEEHITDPIWSMLFENKDNIPKYTKVKLIMEFSGE